VSLRMLIRLLRARDRLAGSRAGAAVADRAQRVIEHVRERIGVPGKQIGHKGNVVLAAERLHTRKPQLGSGLGGISHGPS
jgi:hypothetical protein